MKIPTFFTSDNVAVRLLHDGPTARIYILEGLSRNWMVLNRFMGTDYLLVQISWHMGRAAFEYERSIISQFDIDPERVIWLCNTEEERISAVESGFKAIYCNHNAWLDEGIFTLSNFTEERPYDLAINTRPERWKRPLLAKEAEALAIIKGFNFRKDDYFDLAELSPAYINEKRLAPSEVAEILNKSICGGTFSEEEGACYSSSEMLLCGLPVISTSSRGGRDIWYTPANSIIVEPTPEAVKAAIGEIQEGLREGRFDRATIRSEHLVLSKLFRDRFDALLETLSRGIYGEVRDELRLTNLFQHKMVEYVPINAVERIFSSTTRSFSFNSAKAICARTFNQTIEEVEERPAPTLEKWQVERRNRRASFAVQWYFKPRIKSLVKWIDESNEDTNFTYHLTSNGVTHIAGLIANVCDCELRKAELVVSELLSDVSLKKHIQDVVSGSRYKTTSDLEARFGRRIAWYAIARLLKPRLIVEAGVDKGLGSVVIASALLRNAEEGRPGRYIGIDIKPDAGWLLQGAYAEVGETRTGDSIQVITAIQEPIDIFVSDSDHSHDYETREFLAVEPKLSARGVIIGDNSHVSEALYRHAVQFGKRFLFAGEQPLGHWYPGGGVGVAYSAPHTVGSSH